jgi:CheY-like chemotaxis protein
MMSPPVAGLSPTVLLIDDDPVTLETLAPFFEGDGFQVSLAESAAGALAQVRSRRFDAIVSDLRLPDDSGLTILQRLRAAGDDVPFLVMSGYGTVEVTADAFRQGATDFLPKPVDGVDLVRRVRSAVVAGTGVLAPVLGSSPSVLRATAPSEGMARLVQWLARLISDPRIDRTRLTQAAVADDLKRLLLQTLVPTVIRRDLTIPEFLVCAAAIRRVAAARQGGSSSELLDVVSEALRTVEGPRVERYHPKVEEALGRLAAFDGKAVFLSAAELGWALGIDGEHLARLVHAQTGVTLKDWRRGFRMKRGAECLNASDEHVRQVAFTLGWRHAGEFTRECRCTFGLSPRELRRVIRARPTVE